MSKDFVEVKSHGVLGNESFDLILEGAGQNPHQGLGSETVLGALFVITCIGKKLAIKMRLSLGDKGLQINSDIKPSEFERPNLSDSKSDVKI